MDTIIEYDDELNDDFGQPAVRKPYNKVYRYYRRRWWFHIAHWFWNIILGRPIAWLHAKCRFHWRVVNRKVFRQARRTGYLIYGNHTQNFFDAAMPKIISPKDSYVIVDAANITLPKIGFLVRRLGALPLLDDRTNTRNFIKAVDQIIADRHPIVIYPEAHIWPYYTKIRPFPANVFHYPIKYQVPVFCFTNTYQKRGKKFRIVTYVDGPFYPNPTMDKAHQMQDLRDRVYAKMVERSQMNNYTKIIYRPRAKEQNHA